MHFTAILATLPLGLAASIPATRLAPVIEARGADLISGQYIIKLKTGVSDDALRDALSKLGSTKAKHVYKAPGFKGFASKLDATTLATVQKIPEVSIARILVERPLLTRLLRSSTSRRMV
jgi:hypothetical protein